MGGGAGGQGLLYLVGSLIFLGEVVSRVERFKGKRDG